MRRNYAREAVHWSACEQLRNAIIALSKHLRLWQYCVRQGSVRLRRVISYPNVFLYSCRRLGLLSLDPLEPELCVLHGETKQRQHGTRRRRLRLRLHSVNAGG